MQQYMRDSLPLNLNERRTRPVSHGITPYLVAVQIRQANWAKWESSIRIEGLNAFDRLFIEQHRTFGSPGFVLD